MNTNELLNIIDRLEAAGYEHMELNHEGSTIVLSNIGMNGSKSMKEESLTDEPIQRQEPSKSALSSEPIESKPAIEKDMSEDEELHVVVSPIVGTFYEASGPDVEPFVTVGSKVKKGDTLCIIEAMKLMNEIEAEVSGEIVEILVSNEEGVAYNQQLFKIREV